jgi:hypothetical protein
MKLATIGPAVRTTKPNSHGLRNAYAAQVSRSLNPDAQRRALLRGPGAAAVLETVAKRGSGPKPPPYFCAFLIASDAVFCALFSALLTLACPVRTLLTAFCQASWNSADAGDAGM